MLFRISFLLALILYVRIEAAFFPSEADEGAKIHKDNIMEESGINSNETQLASEIKLIGNETGQIEGRNFIRDKFCSLGFCEPLHHTHGIPPGDVKLVQPVALKPVGGPVHAVPIDRPHQFPHYRPSKALFGAGYEKPGFGVGFEKPGFGLGYDIPGFEKPAFGYEKPAFGYEKPAFGYEKPAFGYDKPAFGYGKPGFDTGYDKPVFGGPVVGPGPGAFVGNGPLPISPPYISSPILSKPLIPPIISHPLKPVDTHVHHHIHHNQPLPPVLLDNNDGFYGAAQKPIVSIASPIPANQNGFQRTSEPKCFCIPASQCYQEPLGTVTNHVIASGGVPHSGMIGYGIDPRNVHRNAPNVTDDEEVTTTPNSRKRRESNGKSEPRQLNYNGNSGLKSDSCSPGYVCCGGTQSEPAATNNYLDQSRIPSISVSRHCGMRMNSGMDARVISGHRNPYYPTQGDSEFGEFPWQAAIVKHDGSFVCSGSLISASHIITAAHCVYRLQATSLKVRIGDWDVNNENEYYKHIENPVKSIIVHPEFNSANLVNDVAILRFNGYIDFESNPHITPICIPYPEMEFRGQRCYVSGWGKDSFGDIGKYQNILKKVDLPVLGHVDCEQKLKRTRLGPDFVLNPGFLCAGGEENKDSCKGDGGGPLSCEREGVWQLAGIVSWGVGCGKKDVPGIHVKTSMYRNFIDTVLTMPNLPGS